VKKKKRRRNKSKLAMSKCSSGRLLKKLNVPRERLEEKKKKRMNVREEAPDERMFCLLMPR